MFVATWKFLVRSVHSDYRMKKAADVAPELCTRFHEAIELIGRRWTGAIIFLLLRSRCRFATLRDAIPEITDRMLSERLQELEQNAIVKRTVVPETPVRVEYSLTKKGRALANAIEAISEWADKWSQVPARVPVKARARKQPRA
jgi:DNA-binding HxlR family transcriptional regulator